MTKRIFRSFCLIAIVVFLLSLSLIAGVLYDYFSNQQMKDLKTATALCAAAIDQKGLDYLKSLSDNDYRITWIFADGTVMFDSKAQSETMENHLEREEIREAFEKGKGESTRRSDTLMEKQLYYAEKLSDGSVLRLSASHLAMWSLIFSMLQPIIIVMVITLGLSLFLAYRFDSTEKDKTMEVRREFTANVSHELKTPLQNISGSAELLANELVKPENVPKFAEQIFDESRRMINLVEDIIKLSHLDEGAEDMQRSTVDLYEMAKETVRNLMSAAQIADIQLSLKGEKSEMEGIPQLLSGILYNLCDNAIKYNRPGGNVHVEVQPSDSNVILTVSDTGIGIPPEARERISNDFTVLTKAAQNQSAEQDSDFQSLSIR